MCVCVPTNHTLVIGLLGPALLDSGEQFLLVAYYLSLTALFSGLVPSRVDETSLTRQDVLPHYTLTGLAAADDDDDDNAHLLVVF